MAHPQDFVRPSGLERIRCCPGAALVQAAYLNRGGIDRPAQDAISSAVADIGKACHAAVAARLGGQRLAGGLDRHSAWCVERCVRLAVEQGWTSRPHTVEVPLDMFWPNAKPGTADLMIDDESAERCIIVDWKFGFLDQGAAADSLQLAAYAVAAALVNGRHNVEAWLVQPRLEESRQITRVVYAFGDLDTAKNAICAIAARAEDADAQLNCGEHCHYCAALAGCAQARDTSMNAKEAMEIIGMPDTPEAFGALIGDAKLAAKWADAVLDDAKIRMAAGEAATGYRLQASGSASRVDREQALALAAGDPARLQALLDAASFSASDLKGVEWVAPAISAVPKSASIRAVKA